MKIRLHEIEFGSGDVNDCASFYQSVLGLQPKLKQEKLTVMDAGLGGFDLNVSTHFAAGVVVVSFLTDDLNEIEKRLQQAGIAYEGPSLSHLGMTSLRFKDPNGCRVNVNSPGTDSPSWLQV